MILMQAPAANMNFGAAPSGAAYVSDQFGLVKIVNDNGNDQTFLINAGCYTLSPFGGWGSFTFNLLADVYAADSSVGLVLPGLTGFPPHTTVTVQADGLNNGLWYKTGSGHGSGNWSMTNASLAPDANAAIAGAASSQAIAAAAQAAVAAAIRNILSTSVTAGGTLPYEVTAVSGGIGTGSGGTPGTYAIGVTGGPQGFQANVTIGSDGKVAGYTILNPGLSTSNSAPTLSLSGVTGLTGATAPTATVGTIPVNRLFYAPSADNATILAWGNNAGTLAAAPFGGTQLVMPTQIGLQSVRPFAVNGNFAGGVVAPSSWLLTPSGGIVATTDSVFNAMGCAYGAVVTASTSDGAQHIITLPRTVQPGDYIPCALLLRSETAGTWSAASNSVSLLLRNSDNSTAATVNIGTSYTQIDTAHRVYFGTIQVPTQSGKTPASVVLRVTGQSTYAQTLFGVAAGWSSNAASKVDYQNWDPDNTVQQNNRLTALENGGSVARPLAVNGNFADGTGQFTSGSAPAGGIVTTTDAWFNAKGVSNVALLSAGTQAFFDPALGRRLVPGGWLAVAIDMSTSVANTWPATGSSFRVITTDVNGAQQSVNFSAYTQTDTTHRRYTMVLQASASNAPITRIQVCAAAPSGTDIRCAYSIGFSDTKPGDVEQCNYDPYSAYLTASKLATIVAPQSAPDLLVQTSYHLVQGRELKLFRDGLTPYRELTSFEIGAVGTNGSEAGDEWATPYMRLDGKRFSGSGFFRAKAKGTDTASYFQTPTTFYSSAATKTGSPKIWQLQDSLHAQGILYYQNLKLTPWGVTPSFVGTIVSDDPILGTATGPLGETRRNWLAANFTYASKKQNGNGQLYAIIPVRPNGGSGLTITATVSAGAVTALTLGGSPTGYPDGTWDVWVKPLSGSNNSGRAARARITFSGGAPTGYTIDDGGAGYTSAPTCQLAMSISEYNASSSNADYGDRWVHNPFIRPATSAEISASDPRIQNGYIFDFQYHVTNFLAGSVPDILILGPVMNDVWNGGGTAASAFAAVQQMVTAIRVVTNNPLAITIPGQATPAIWASLVTYTKLIMAQYKGQEGSGIFILPLFQAIDDKFTYPFSATSTDSQTGQQTGTISDATHFGTVGMSQAAEMEASFVMNRL